MSNADTLPGAKLSAWTICDNLRVAAVLVLLAGVTAVVALRGQWTRFIGVNIAPVPIATLSTSDFHSLAFDPRDPDTVYFGHRKGVLKSVDGGVTWSPVLRQGDAISLVAVDNALVTAGHETLMRSDSAGAI